MKRNPSEDLAFYKITKLDILLVALVLFFSSFAIAWANRGIILPASGSKSVLIYKENKLLEKVSLEKDAMITLLDGKMELEVKQGRIRVASSDCPQHICKHMGWIESNGQTIVCVPNKIMVEVKSTGEALIDAVAN